jgi:predicted nucleic acid-binding protein
LGHGPWRASRCATWTSKRKKGCLLGRPIFQFDAQIAAIARATGVGLATRNVSDFDHCGIDAVDPWT